MVLSREYPAYFYHCMGLMLLDIASHWLQMYSQLLAEKASHKDVDTSAFFLLRRGFLFGFLSSMPSLGRRGLFFSRGGKRGMEGRREEGCTL